MCSYAMSKRYKKYFRATKKSLDVTPNEESVIKVKGAEKYKFRKVTQGITSVISQNQSILLSRIPLPPGKLCSLEELDLK